MCGQTIWIEWTVDGHGHPKAGFDHARSQLGSGDFTFQESFPDTAGDVYLEFSRKAAALADILILPSTLLALIVRGPAWDCLSELVAGHFHARPVKVVTRDKIVAEFMAVKPAEAVECIDFERSEGIEWLIPDRFTNNWKTLRFRDGCLGALPWARVEHIDRLAVKDEIKRRLTEIDPKGIHFVTPEELPPWRRPRR